MDNKAIIAKALDVLKLGSKDLTDEEQKTYFDGTIKSLEEAQGLVKEDLEKEARLVDASVKFANQLCFILFREEKLTEELAKEYRSLPTPEETSKEVRGFNEDREARIADLNEKHAKIVEEQKELDIFLGVISGMSAEEAQKRMEEHDEKIKQATAKM